MNLTLHYHPLASFCWKALVGLYELEVPFRRNLVDLGNATERAALAKLWPMTKFPVLHDAVDDRAIPESSIILEYIDRHATATSRLLPADPERALTCRLRDRFFDMHVHLPMQKIVGDKLRPAGGRDPIGVQNAKEQIETAYGIANEWARESEWAAGDAFTMADCAAAPALFYANKVVPFGEAHRDLAAYFARLEKRPSFARVLREAEPYMRMFPG
jgi:glutathione S-transferase